MKIHQIGQRLRAIRKAADLRTRDVAEKVSLAASQIGHIEAGRRMPPLPTLARIAAAMNHRLEIRFVPHHDALQTVHLSNELAEAVDVLEGTEGLDREVSLALLSQITALSEEAKVMILAMLQAAHAHRST